MTVILMFKTINTFDRPHIGVIMVKIVSHVFAFTCTVDENNIIIRYGLLPYKEK